MPGRPPVPWTDGCTNPIWSQYLSCRDVQPVNLHAWWVVNPSIRTRAPFEIDDARVTVPLAPARCPIERSTYGRRSRAQGKGTPLYTSAWNSGKP